MIDQRTAIFDDLEDNKRWLKERLGIGTSFDVLARDLTIAGVACHIVALDGLLNAEVMTLTLATVLRTRGEQVTPDDLAAFLRERVPFLECEPVDSLEDAANQILAGPAVLFIDGCDRALSLDTRQYPAREPEEPDVEKVVVGPKDGFVETMLANVTLVRRRVRDHNLRVEGLKVGRRSQTDVALLYVKDIVQPDLVRRVRRRLQSIETDAVPMGEKAIAEFIGGPRQWWNPFPTVRYTERADICAVHLMEGRVVVIVDTTPVALILPATFFDQMENAEEYHVVMTAGAFARAVRYGALFLSWFFAPLYVWLVVHPQLVPPWLKFIGPQEPGPIPFFLQFVIGDLAIELIRASLLNMPQTLSTTLGVIGAVIIGQVATKVKLLSPEAILYVVVAALGQYSVPTLDLADATRVFRFILFFLAAVPWWQVLPAGIAVNLAILATTQSFGEAYLWPLIPLDVVALWGVLVRGPTPVKHRRPSLVAPRDPDRF